jgi:predicted exporter
MLNLLREGGGPMLFVVVFGALTFAAATAFAARGDRRRLGFVTWMGVATLLSIGGGLAADFAAVGHDGLARCAEHHIEPLACVLVGFAESMAPAIVGFTLLSLSAMLTAIGMSRTARASAAA